jgi:hypothetical protein
MYGEYSDDEDRDNYVGAYGPCFMGDDDRDIMNDEYDMACGEPRCGGCYRYTQYGCRHCSAPDAEAINSDLEIYDCPAFQPRLRELWMLASIGYALCPTWNEAGRAHLERTVPGFNPRLSDAANNLIRRLCDRLETHGEVLEAYEAWRAKVRVRLSRG